MAGIEDFANTSRVVSGSGPHNVGGWYVEATPDRAGLIRARIAGLTPAGEAFADTIAAGWKCVGGVLTLGPTQHGLPAPFCDPALDGAAVDFLFADGYIAVLFAGADGIDVTVDTSIDVWIGGSS